VANDRTSFTLIFDSFVASSGSGVPVTESRKNCQLNLNIHVPAGMGLADATFDYRGYVQLPAGVSAEEGSAYNLDGNPIDDASSSFTGPVTRDYLSRDSLALDLSTSCEERVVTVNIDHEVRLQGTPASQAQITNDSLDGKITGTTQPCGPVTKDDCKKGGWQTFVGAPGPFKNQGDCVSYVATGGKNKGQGN
jgi:hypothetical protein